MKARAAPYAIGGLVLGLAAGVIYSLSQFHQWSATSLLVPLISATVGAGAGAFASYLITDETKRDDDQSEDDDDDAIHLVGGDHHDT